MAGNVTVSSSTDTQEQVNAAAAHGTKPSPEVEKAESTSEAHEAETEAVSETVDEEEEKAEESEEGQPEEVVGKTRRKLLRQVSRLNGRNITLQEQLEEANERLRRLEGKPGNAPQAPSGKPVPAQFKTYEEYVEALADWKVGERDRNAAQAKQDEYLKQVFDSYNSQVEQARDSYDDFDKVVGQAVSVPVIAINAMYEMENGAEVAYFLGKHPEVRDQLLEWNSPGTKGGFRKIIVELDRISSELGGNTAASSGKNGSSPKPRPQTTAPAPIRPLGGASSTRSAVHPDNMSFADYKKWYAKTYGHNR